jgi:hypothetical protein
MFIPVGSGPSQSDNINRMIQLTVIQLSGGHCNTHYVTHYHMFLLSTSLIVISVK